MNRAIEKALRYSLLEKNMVYVDCSTEFQVEDSPQTSVLLLLFDRKLEYFCFRYIVVVHRESSERKES